MLPKRPGINRARQSLSACATVSRRAPASTASTHRVQRARDLCASMAPFVAAAFEATLVRLPAPLVSRPIAWHAWHAVTSNFMRSSHVPQEPTSTSLFVGRLLDAAGHLTRCAGAAGCSQRSREECRERAARGLRVPARLLPLDALACCDRSDLERCWRGCAADPGDCALVMNTLGAKLTHGMYKHRWCERRERFTWDLVKLTGLTPPRGGPRRLSYVEEKRMRARDPAPLASPQVRVKLQPEPWRSRFN